MNKLDSVMGQDDESVSLGALRSQIDEVDERLAALLAQRQALVKQAANLKHIAGEGVISSQREICMLEHGAALERQYGLPPTLLQDIQRRILRQSYKEKGSGHYSCAYAAGEDMARPVAQCTVVIVGGAGAMARLFTSYLQGSNYRVLSVDKDDYTVDIDGRAVSEIGLSKAAALLQQADWCIVSVPIDVTEQVIATVAPMLRPNCVLSDFTSIKERPMQAMLKAHSGPVLGLHPMFGPDTASLVRQVIVAVPGQQAEQSKFILEQFKLYGALVIECSALEHDQAMRVIQALRHFTTFAYGVFLRQSAGALGNLPEDQGSEHTAAPAGAAPNGAAPSLALQALNSGNSFLRRLLLLSSPIYHLELMMVGRLFAQDPHLYCDIISASQDNLKLIRQYLDCAASCLDMLEHDDKAKFVEEFADTSDFFGQYATLFLKESADILAKAQDNYPVDIS